MSAPVHPNDAAIPVPYTSRLAQPLQAGQTLNIHGAINDGAKRVEINLLQGAPEINEGSQAILHCNLRFDEGKIVLNSYTNKSWGKEERVSLPFKAGQKFDLRVRCHAEHLEISCDGHSVHEFKHRGDFQAIEYFQIKGDCTLTGVHWGGRYYQVPWETGFPSGGLQSGQRIYMYGIQKGDRWSFDLVARNGDLLFHFNPRLDQKAVVRNAHRKGFWEKEEREGPFPFEKNTGFDLTIVNEPYSIQMFVNGEQIGTFAHRCENPVGGDYIGMRIDGDVEITGIEFSH